MASSLLGWLPNCSLLNASSNYYASDSRQAGEDPLTRYLKLGYSLLFLVVGVPGDLVSMLLWYQRIKGSQGSTSLFLTVLCAVDTLVLVQGCLRHLIITVTCHDPRLMMGCSWPLFVYTWLSNTSVWIICLMCVERLICVCWPFRMKSVCQLRNGAAALGAAGLLLAACDLPLLFMVDPDTCEERLGFGSLRRAFNMVDSVVYSYLPFALIVALNAVILVRLGRQRRSLAAAARGGGGGGGGGARRQASNKIFVTVFAMAVSHLLFTAPIVAWHHGLSDLCQAESPVCFRVELACQILERLNHLIHFFIFSVTSSLFVADAKALLARLSCGRRPQRQRQGRQAASAMIAPKRATTAAAATAELELQETRQQLS